MSLVSPARLVALINRARLASRRANADYKAWWNAAATFRSGAYATTYVTDNEEDYRSRGWHGDANSFGARQLLEMCGLGRSSRVLEIGCGAARIGREMAPYVAEWHGADISENMLSVARKRTVGLENVYLHSLDDVGLSGFSEGTFDGVYATTVFMHLDKEDVFQYVAEAYRVLKPAAAFYFDTWNLLHPDTWRQWRSIQAENHGLRKSRGRIQFSTAQELRRYAEEAGFEVLRLEEDKLLRVLCRKGELVPLEPDDQPPFGYIDEPRNEAHITSNSLAVVGWALDDVTEIQVRLDDATMLGVAGLGQPRPDVAPLFPRYPGAATSGYSVALPLAGVSPGHHTLQVIALDRAGRSTDLAGQYLGVWIED